jgi:hypothetical protein
MHYLRQKFYAMNVFIHQYQHRRGLARTYLITPAQKWINFQVKIARSGDAGPSRKMDKTINAIR